LRVLDKDIDHCLTTPYAQSSAITFCLSTIDLLGALYSGQAASRPDRNHRAKPGKTVNN